MTAGTDLVRSVCDALRPGGAVSKRLPGYESRPAQVGMADVVAKALDEGRHAIVEGGTGVGKSLAYLVPAILSGQKVIISTANKTLQDQLISKDIPFLQNALGRDVKAALVKGRGNYLCLDRFTAEERFQVMAGMSPAYRRLKGWAAATAIGDVEEIETPLGRDLLRRIVSTSRTCTGDTCAYFGDCFVEKMRARAEEASLVVCNHALLLADLVVRDMGAYLLPDRDAIIIDEAHRLEDAALSALTVSLSRYDIGELSDSPLRRYAGDDAVDALRPLVDAMLEPFDRRGRQGRDMVDGEIAAGVKLATLLEELADRLARKNPFSGPPSVDSRHYERLVEWTARLAENARLVSVPNDQDSVRYVDYTGSPTGELALKWTPVDVSEPLAEILFRQSPVICTSATLAVGDFSFFRRSVGIDDALEHVAASPFDYQDQCLLYVPAHLPEFRGTASPAYTDALCDEIEHLVNASEGRAFILFTSYRAMHEAHARLQERLPFTVFKQGELPRGELLRRFRDDGAAVLFATKSFWEGVDVVGEALSLVVIDRMPFSVPDDPVVMTRVDHMKRDGGDWFNDLMLPQATLQLKQGFGRLIRSHADRGVVAILDSRLARRAYGRRVLTALPPARIARRVEEVRAFFEAG